MIRLRSSSHSSNIWEITVNEITGREWNFIDLKGILDMENANKSYYAFTELNMPSDKANKICQAFDMNLAAPQNQNEFDQLRKFVSKSGVKGFLAIAGYRSEIDGNVWVDSSNKVNYSIDWATGKPNNNGGGDCIGRTRV